MQNKISELAVTATTSHQKASRPDLFGFYAEQSCVILPKTQSRTAHKAQAHFGFLVNDLTTRAFIGTING